jgi:hypothetical protein
MDLVIPLRLDLTLLSCHEVEVKVLHNRHESPEGGKGIALLSLDLSTLKGGGWSAAHPSYPRVPIVQEAGLAPGPVWTCVKNLAPPGLIPTLSRLWPVTTQTELSWLLCLEVVVINRIDEGCMNPGRIILCTLVPNVFNIFSAPSRKFQVTGSQLVYSCGYSVLNFFMSPFWCLEFGDGF